MKMAVFFCLLFASRVDAAQLCQVAAVEARGVTIRNASSKTLSLVEALDIVEVFLEGSEQVHHLRVIREQIGKKRLLNLKWNGTGSIGPFQFGPKRLNESQERLDILSDAVAAIYWERIKTSPFWRFDSGTHSRELVKNSLATQFDLYNSEIGTPDMISPPKPLPGALQELQRSLKVLLGGRSTFMRSDLKLSTRDWSEVISEDQSGLPRFLMKASKPNKISFLEDVVRLWSKSTEVMTYGVLAAVLTLSPDFVYTAAHQYGFEKNQHVSAAAEKRLGEVSDYFDMSEKEMEDIILKAQEELSALPPAERDLIFDLILNHEESATAPVIP